MTGAAPEPKQCEWVARTAGKESAEHIAKELNEKGFVETVP